jgi:hypothetical protein
MKTYGGVELQLRYQLHAPAVYPRGNSPRTHCIGGWVGRISRSGPCVREEKNLLSLPGIKPRLLGRRARSLVAIPTRAIRLNPTIYYTL